MTKILHLDTTTPQLMLGLSDAETMLAEFTAPCESHRYHSAMLVPAIQSLFKNADIKAEDLTALAINMGPGSFTGIRTGITTARTMGQFLNLPIYGFNSFELLVYAQNKANMEFDIYIDALRLRTYHARLQFTQNGPVYSQEPELHMLSADGNTANQATLLLSPALTTLFIPNPSTLIEPHYSPAIMLQLIQQYGDHFAKDWAAIKPFYLQAPSITLKKAPA